MINPLYFRMRMFSKFSVMCLIFRCNPHYTWKYKKNHYYSTSDICIIGVSLFYVCPHSYLILTVFIFLCTEAAILEAKQLACSEHFERTLHLCYQCTTQHQSADEFYKRMKVSWAETVWAGPGVRNNMAQSHSTVLPKHSHQGVLARPGRMKGWTDGGMNRWVDTKEEWGLVNKHLRADMLPTGMQRKRKALSAAEIKKR